MNHKSTLRFSLLLLLLALLATGIMLSTTGCSSAPKPPKPKPLTLNIKAGGLAANLTITVYVGAANQPYDAVLLPPETVDQILQNKSLINSPEIKFFPLTSKDMKIEERDPIWSIWRDQKRANNLVVIADLPKNFGNFSGPNDARRVVIPLDRRLWQGHLSDNTVHVEIRENGVKLLDVPGL